MLRIDAVQTHHVCLPLDTPVRTAIHDLAEIHNVLVEVQADGLVGIGYALAFTPHQAAALRHLVRDLAEDLPGADASLVRAHWQRARQRLNFTGRAGLGALALGAVDTALWDLAAQAAGLPLFRALGAERDEVAVYATGGWLSLSTGELVEEAQRLRDAGFDHYKLKVGLPDWRDDVARVGALRSALGTEMGLMVDANQGWSVTTAIAAGTALAELALAWLEEPVDADDIAGAAQVSAAIDVPVAAGETVFGLEGFRALVEHAAADVLMPDLARCAGPTGFLQVASLADAASLPVTAHTFTEVSAHLIAACAQGTFVEYVPGWWERLFEEAPAIVDGRLRLPDTPGLGVRFSAEAKARFGTD